MFHKAAPESKVVLETEGALAWIVIDNPARLNALTLAMWRQIPALVAEANADPAVRVIILRGRGEKAFSAGADISEFAEMRTGDGARVYDDANTEAFEALMGSQKPVIAMVYGFCLGGGCELALCCDLRIAAEDAEFGIPAARLGIGYNARWIKPLLASLSPSNVKEMLFTGGRFGAKAASRMGLVNRVSPVNTIEDDARQFCNQIAANAPLSIKAAKAAIEELSRGPHPDYAALDALTDACFASEDYAEGRAAFAEKRKPVFKGR